MAKHPSSLSNFKLTVGTDRVAIVDVSHDAVKGTQYFELASAKTEEEAKLRFYSRYMVRSVDRGMMDNAQRRNSLHVMRFIGSAMSAIENNVQLIALDI